MYLFIFYRCSEVAVIFFEKYLWWNVIFCKFVWYAFLPLTTGAEELYFFTLFCWTTFVEHLSKVAYMLWKAGENFRETSGILRQISSSSLMETSAGRLTFLKKQRNEKVNFCLTHCIQFTHCFNKVFSMSLRSMKVFLSRLDFLWTAP